MPKLLRSVAILSVGFICGLGAYYLVGKSFKKGGEGNKQQQKVLYWVAPMDPSFRKDKPGKSPMGMDLVPVYADDQGQSESTDADVKIPSHVVNTLGVKTASVTKKNLSRIIDTVGYVTADENNIEHVHTYTDGWVRTLSVNAAGDVVKKGQLLLELYSPSLNNSQEELLLALNTNNKTLINASEKKLVTLGMSQRQIDQLKATRKLHKQVKIFSSTDGIVSALNIRKGEFVKPETDLMTIEDLSTVWLISEVFERQASWVAPQQRAIAMLPYLPGKRWQGVVDYVYPELNPKTHTVQVRLVFPNPDLTIKTNMYADVKILSATINNALSVPKSAVIRSQDGDRVIVALGEGRFKPQQIRVGIESGNYFQVLSGLKEGDKVVTSAQFLLDSESNLRASFDRMAPKESAETPNTPMALPQEYVAMGEILAVNAKTRTVTLKHQPIPELDMPAMTMALPLARDVNMASLHPGDSIHFVMQRTDNDGYLVTKIHVITPSSSNHQ